MYGLTTYSTAGQITPAQNITEQLFLDFVAWIDRSENTTRAYLINLRRFMEWLRAGKNLRPERQDIVSYREYLIAKGHKPNTITAYLRSVKQFFSWAAANNIYPNVSANVHAPKVDHSSHKKDALTVQEVLNIEQSIESHAESRAAAAAAAYKDRTGKMQRSSEQGKRLYAMYLLAVNSGLRTVELSRANVKDLETKSGQSWLYIWGKGRAEPDQRKALAPEVAAAVKEYLKSRTDRPTGASPLFVSTGNRSKGQRIAATTISTMLKRAMQEAGFDSERLTAHSLRHTAGTAVMTMTGNLYTTQKYMRHTNPATTEIYIHDNENTQKQEQQTARQLYSLYHGGQQLGAQEQSERGGSPLTPAQLEKIIARAVSSAAR